MNFGPIIETIRQYEQLLMLLVNAICFVLFLRLSIKASTGKTGFLLLAISFFILDVDVITAWLAYWHNAFPFSMDTWHAIIVAGLVSEICSTIALLLAAIWIYKDFSRKRWQS